MGGQCRPPRFPSADSPPSVRAGDPAGTDWGRRRRRDVRIPGDTGAAGGCHRPHARAYQPYFAASAQGWPDPAHVEVAEDTRLGRAARSRRFRWTIFASRAFGGGQLRLRAIGAIRVATPNSPSPETVNPRWFDPAGVPMFQIRRSEARVQASGPTRVRKPFFEADSAHPQDSCG